MIQNGDVTHVWVVSNRSECECDHCYGHSDIEVYLNEQTARQEAERRSRDWNGYLGAPDMHVQRVQISTKVRKW